MAHAQASPGTAGAHQSPISIPYVLASSILTGIGIFSMTYWVITFDWLYFLGVLPCLAGVVLLLSPRAGANQAA
jgi:hypothetical protein